ncbi:unnamed protein product [marine sediment metagenome]|uniref:Uncharacterized protein n=1 Tax=marine sediment metagenome TaxID=412755 RepID=X1DW52_9ZZZZ
MNRRYTFTTKKYAEDDELEGKDDDGFGKDLISVAIGFLAFGTLNIIALYTFRGSRKLLGDECKAGKTKKTIKSIYQKIRKPLSDVIFASHLILAILLLLQLLFLLPILSLTEDPSNVFLLSE